MKRVLITGSDGQLGSALKKASADYRMFDFTFIDIKDIDLTNYAEVNIYFDHHTYDYIINCAAYTAVDLAENNHELAYNVNAGIPENLVRQCVRGTRLIHMSTDYVYDGSKNLPHLEDDMPAPASVYAKSKLAGENVLKDNPLCMIIRTSWLYSEYGSNFVKTMIRLSGERKELNVVYDQIGTPTYAGDLAIALFTVLLNCEQKSFPGGIYNFSNEGVCSWYDLAYEIMKYTGSSCKINPITTTQYPLPASRPVYSVMDKSKIKRTFGISIPYWRDSLQIAINNLKANNN